MAQTMFGAGSGRIWGSGVGLAAGAAMGAATVALSLPIALNPQQALVDGPAQIKKQADPFMDWLQETPTPVGWALGQWRRSGATITPNGIQVPAPPDPKIAEREARAAGLVNKYGLGGIMDVQAREADLASTEGGQRVQSALRGRIGDFQAQGDYLNGKMAIQRSRNEDAISKRRYQEDIEFEKTGMERDYWRGRQDIGTSMKRQRRDLGVQRTRAERDIELGYGYQTQDIRTQTGYQQTDVQTGYDRGIRDIQTRGRYGREDIQTGYRRSVRNAIYGQVFGGGLIGSIMSARMSRRDALADLEKDETRAKEGLDTGRGDALTDIGTGATRAGAAALEGRKRAYAGLNNAQDDASADINQRGEDAVEDLGTQFDRRMADFIRSTEKQTARMEEDIKRREEVRKQDEADLEQRLKLAQAINQGMETQAGLIDGHNKKLKEALDKLGDLPFEAAARIIYDWSQGQ